jgi:twinkle protein
MDVTTAGNQALSRETIAFIEARGLDQELAERLNLRTYESAGKQYIRFDYGTHTKSRNITDKHDCFIEGGAGLPLFNASVVSDETLGQTLVITEGEFDAISAIQAGHVRTVSVPNGSKSLSDENIQLILDNVNDNDDIIIAQDNDEAGMGMLNELSSRLGKSRCRYLQYPYKDNSKLDRCKDLNEVLLAYGEEGVASTIARAKYVAVPGLHRMDDLPDIPTKKMYDIGIKGLEKIKVRLGEWSVFTGIPGHGKSTFMTEWACHAQEKYGWKTLFASFEHPPQEDHKENLQRWKLAGDPAKANPEQLKKANKWINDSFTFCFPDYEQDVSIDWLFDIIETSVKRFGTKLVIIDPWNMIDHENNESELSGTQYVAACLREFRRMAMRLNIHLCIVAHPTKMMEDKDGNYKVPSLYNISDSANWNNMCNIGFVIYRNDVEGTSILRVEKCKYGSKLGISNREDTTLIFNPFTNRYAPYNEIREGE